MKTLFTALCLFASAAVCKAQVKSFGSIISEGNTSYERKNFPEAEKAYRKALEKEKGSTVGEYNLADALYKQKKYAEAGNLFRGLGNKEKDKAFLSDIYHNLGNSLLAEKKYEESIEAYKNSLRLQPDEKNTRYNLSYALSKLKQQQQQQKSNKNKDKKENKDKQQQQQQKNQSGDKKDKQEQQQQQEAQKGKMSKEQAEQLLGAIAKQEKDLNEKMKKKKARAGGYKPEKDW